ncbi:hypothetical protein SG34_033735 [Thalassomonas viridans]|uniref:Uncharacterized protein n=1 Tax=Thalassomonas viridans TaxID=137584 RepID=A0AAE9ZAE4_9GAMM|nr:hypothetical protein [Thalassomonas viridans]WDE08855.1 hypothetical protein SG34_033735 [Thalassomonas viridans]
MCELTAEEMKAVVGGALEGDANWTGRNALKVLEGDANWSGSNALKALEGDANWTGK